MFLSKNPLGIWYVYYDKPNGKRSSRSTRSKKKGEALRFLRKFQKELREIEDREFIPITLKQFNFNFLRYSEPYYTDKTMTVYKATFNMLKKHFGENIQLSELTTPRIEDYLRTRLKDSSVYAARHDLANLSCAFNKAVRDGYLINNPCKSIRRFRIPEKQPLFYSESELESLINAIDEPDTRDIAILAVNTGLRQGEILTLEWRQINFDDRFLTLDNRTHTTKGKRVHTLPINKKAMEVLSKRYENKNGLPNVFTLKDEAIRQDWFSKYFKKFILKAGLNPKLNFHSLRHTFASYLVQKGVSIYTVSKLLTHADIKTTQIYAHLRRDDLRAATDLL